MKRRREIRSCVHCSLPFEAKPSDPKRYCEHACYVAHESARRRALAAAKGCRVEGCTKPHHTRGWCSMHYQRVVKNGAPGPVGAHTRRGAGNPNWKGGRVRGGEGGRYWMRWVPDHPGANPLGYVLEHRLVMEELLGRRLAEDEIVHHVNHDPSDNRPENLAVMTAAEHALVHAEDRRRVEVSA